MNFSLKITPSLLSNILVKNTWFLVFILLASSSFSQQIKVINQSTKAGIEGVFVYNINQSVNAISDSTGTVDISSFKKRDTLIFTHAGYATFIIPKLNVGNAIYLEKSQIELPTFKISATKNKEKALEATSTIDVIDKRIIALNNPQTAAEMLELSGSVYIQKSQMGGGSPIIRGFEANRVLLVVDGVRMNNAIYRSGHLQNAITIDNSILEKTDIIYGPNSVIYGSDALGGVVHYYTKMPQFRLKTDSVNNYSVNAYSRYASANQEKTGHFDINLGFKKIASLTSITFSEFSDLRMGKTTHPDYPDFGIEKYYAGRINEVDTMIRKDDFLIQQGTAYHQIDALQKLSYQLSDNVLLSLNTQYSSSSNIPRYDQLTNFSGNTLKYAEWFYGPQNRLLSSLSAQIKSNKKWVDNAEILLSYQKIDEDRITRRFGNNNRVIRNEDVTVFGLNADFLKINSNKSQWFYGLELTHNDVQSTAHTENIMSFEKSTASTRYPDGGSTLSNMAAYLSYKKNFSEKATYNLGARYSYSILSASFNDTTFIQLPFSEINLTNGALTGSAGLVYRPNDKWKINMGLSTAYRAPNVDDVGKVFSKSNFVMIPNDQLTPEYAYNGEIGITRGLLNNKIKINVVGFYTLLNNAIVRKEFQLGDIDSLAYEGETLKIQANVNASKAVIYGSSITLLTVLSDEVKFKSTLNYTVGENTTDSVPLAHIPPLYGRTDFIFTSHPLIVNIYVKYQAWKKLADFSLNGEDNEDKATVDGTPAWQTYNISASIKVSKSFTLQAALENLLDTHYRPFASGVSAPGRNFIFTLRASF